MPMPHMPILQVGASSGSTDLGPTGSRVVGSGCRVYKLQGLKP